MNNFNEILDTFENDDLKQLAIEAIKTIPTYFYEVAASSTGKYHPQYALGTGGLYRHTLALCKIMNHIFEVTNYNSRDKDMMRIAGIMHDTRKSGSQEEYEKNKYTNFDHPIKAAEVFEQFKNKDWDNCEIEAIQGMIRSHMGRWNTDKRSEIVLPTPSNKYENMVHLADYLASRKDIEIKFEVPGYGGSDFLSVNTLMPFGTHRGTPIKDVDPGYLNWMIKQPNIDDKLKSIARIVLEKK